MLLHIEPGAMVDLFENRPEMAYEKAFVWLAADQAIDDTTPPRVDLVLTKAGELEVGFSEEIDPQIASAAILLDGAPRTWTAMPDGYTLKPASAISATTHSLQIGPALVDKAGRPLAETFARNITTGGTDQIAYERPDPRITPTSTLDNLASFQGHITDPATGLVYMRNRWMDPEMGRFMTPDPMGYTSGPSSYDGFGGSPFVTCDPFGLYEADLHFGLTYFIAKSFGLTFGEALQVAEADENIDLFDWTNPTLQARQGNWQVVYDFHFPLVGSHESVREGVSASSNEAAWSGIFSAQNLSELGYGLHTLQDSFSHAGATRGNLLSKLALTNAQAVALLAIKSPELGITHNIHASDISNYGDFNGTDVPGMHAVDWTFTNPSKAMRAARATFQAIEFFCQARTSNQCASPVASRARLSELEAVIRQFASADTAKGKKEWFMLYAPEVLSLIPWDDLSLDSRITHR